MNFVSVNFESVERLFPAGLQLNASGYQPRKESWVRHAFGTFNFSFILQGSGSYCFEDRTYAVNAPCVLVQRPGAFVEYGPEDWWEEVYFTYPATAVERLLAANLAKAEVHVWKIHRVRQVESLLRRISEYAERFPAIGVADQIDRLCEQLILESLLPEEALQPGVREVRLREIQAVVENNYNQEIDFVSLAGRHGMSDATFRRGWSQINPLTPHQYQTELRMREARRLLGGTTIRISEIAAQVGYEDALYFSRRFRQAHGVSARDYRRLYAG